jgi:hypothetical protein
VKTLLVAYDLNRPGQNYDTLIAKIKELANGYWHELDSTWLVRADMTPSDMRDQLRMHIDAGDELLVMDVTGDLAAWAGFSKVGSEWILKYL